MTPHEQLVDEVLLKQHVVKSFWTLMGLLSPVAIAALIVPVVYAVSYVGG